MLLAKIRRTLSCCLAAAALCLTVPAQGEKLLTVTNNHAGDNFGAACAVAGDVDADGLPDYIVGAYLDGSMGIEAGAAFVYSGANGSELWSFFGAPGERLGFAVGAAGDVDNDGHADLIVCADGGNYVRVYSGQTGLVHDTFPADSATDEYGWAVGCAGDLNGDQHDDVYVGAPGSAAGSTGSGLVRIFSGADSSVLRDWPGASPGLGFGFAVARAERVDADNVADFVIGFPSATNRAQVVSGVDGSVIHDWFGDNVTDWFGTAVAVIGDRDNDGFDDVAIGASAGFGDSGYVRVFSGQSGNEVFTLPGGSAIELFGFSLAGVGDVDEDGHGDVAIAAPFADGPQTVIAGRVSVHSGADGSLLYELFGAQDDTALGWSISAAPFAPLMAGGPGPLTGGVAALHDSGRTTRPHNYCALVPNSRTSGARIVATGSGSLSHNNLSLRAEDLPLSQFGYFLMSRTQNLIVMPGNSEGNLCIGSPLIRILPPVLNSGSSGSYSFNVNAALLPGIGAITSGQTWNFQSWFRDGQTSNFTDGVRVTFVL